MAILRIPPGPKVQCDKANPRCGSCVHRWPHSYLVSPRPAKRGKCTTTVFCPERKEVVRCVPEKEG